MEIVVVIAVLAIIATISAVAFKNLYHHTTLKAVGSEVYGALTTAREKTLSSQGDQVFGVRVATSSVTLFEGTTYATSSPTNDVYQFPGGVTATGTAFGDGTSILFTRLTGGASATSTLYIRTFDHTATRTIRVYASGLIEYE